MGLILSLLKDVQSKNFAAAARDNDKHKLGAPAQTMDYYHHVRREIAPLLPSAASRILEVGAGAGGTLKWLKDTYPNAETTAVELNGALRDELQRNADVVLIGSIEETFPLLKKYDLILLLDVLEPITCTKVWIFIMRLRINSSHLLFIGFFLDVSASYLLSFQNMIIA